MAVDYSQNTDPELAAPPEALLNEHALADLLSVSVATVRAWRLKKIGPPVTKVEGSVRYRASAVHAYLNERTVKTKN